MSLQSKSVVLVSSHDSNTGEFGTGFVIHHAGDTTYVLTAAHVVKDIGEQCLRVGNLPAKVFKASPPREFDIAVLEVKGLLDVPPLILSKVGAEANRITILGFYKPVRSHGHSFSPIHGSLKNQGMISSERDKERVVSWHLNIDEEYSLKRGYSGSPVIDNTSNHVLGVVGIAENNGREGIAISVTALKKIWPDAPFDLEEDVPQTSQFMMSRTETTQISLFYADQDVDYKRKFEEMCLIPLESKGIIKVWSKDKIRAGYNRRQETERNLANSSIVLLLISRKFMSSYHKDEHDLKFYVSKVMQNENTKVIPILLRKEISWEQEFGDLQCLPKNRKFVDNKSWGNQDDALSQIAKEFREELALL